MVSVLRVAGIALVAGALALVALATGGQRAGGEAALNEEARSILQELVELDTSGQNGTTRAAQAMAARFRAEGFPPGDIHLVGPADHKQNLVVRLRGSGRARPLLLLAHLDVVEARREDWSVDPFTLLERGGYYYGRGTTDMKDMAAAWVVALLEMKRRGLVPDRDVILALTADEEGGDANGVDWLVRHRRHLIDAEFCLTEGGGGQMHDGRNVVYRVQAAEKVYLSFRLEARDAGGHSALPRPGNPIYRLAAALERSSRLEFPARLNEITTAFFRRMAAVEGGAIGRDMELITGGDPAPDALRRLSRLPYYNALIRTTCVATRVEAGHAENALPQSATAVVNCRLLPGDVPGDVEGRLVEAVADPEVVVSMIGEADSGPVSPLAPEVMGPIEQVAGEMWPGVPVVPVMEAGATDGRILRRAGIPTYGLGAFQPVEDDRAHGRDERIGVRQFREERQFLARLVTRLSEAPSRPRPSRPATEPTRPSTPERQ
ncbi:MAG TPA: M20/M25/M40 family metallo-hydrolase [Vicinamibacterales bacterium]|nr:M20/M25/M40 family metallo-hydrolase [Vicinamibacterales bacterium]